MDETPIASETKPVIGPELVDEIALLLGIENATEREHLATRVQRYSDWYFFALERQEILFDEGVLKENLESIASQITKLEHSLRGLETSSLVKSAYLRARIDAGNSERPSLDGLRDELASMKAIAAQLISAPALKRGPKGRQYLRHAIGSIMALFETLTGERVETCTYRDGLKGKYLKGDLGRALLTVFEAINPDLEEKTLANLVDKLRAEYDGREMREGSFHLISQIEDDREAIVEQIER